MPASFTFTPRSHNIVTQSFADGSTEVWPRWFSWEAIADWPILTHVQYHKLTALLEQAEGRVFPISVPLFHYRSAIGTKTGSLTFGPEGAGSTSITVFGGSGAFAAGDFIQIEYYAYRVISDQVGGVIQIRPGLREAYAAGSRVWHLDSFRPGSQWLEHAMEITSDLGSAAFPGADATKPLFRELSVGFEGTRKPNP